MRASLIATGATAEVRNTTRVGSAVLQITKLGGLDAACDGTADGSFQLNGIGAQPGMCVLWQLTVENKGTEEVCEVSLADEAPLYSTLFGNAVVVSEPAPGTGSCVQADGAVTCKVGNAIDISGDSVPELHCLRPGESASVRFGVQIE